MALTLIKRLKMVDIIININVRLLSKNNPYLNDLTRFEKKE